MMGIDCDNDLSFIANAENLAWDALRKDGLSDDDMEKKRALMKWNRRLQEILNNKKSRKVVRIR